MAYRAQPSGGTVFLAAVRRGDDSVVSSLLAEQPALCQHTDTFGKDALHYARLMGHSAIVNMLEHQTGHSSLARCGIESVSSTR